MPNGTDPNIGNTTSSTGQTGSPSTSSGTGGAPPAPAAPVRTAHRIGGRVQDADTGAGLAGASMTIATVDAAGNPLPINGQPAYTTQTDAAGNYAADLALAPGDAFYVRPASPAPAGYLHPPGTSNNTYSKQAHTGADTPLGQPTYEQQVIGDRDCSSTPGRPGGACDFIYNKVPAAPAKPPAAPTDPNYGKPVESACLKPLLRYVNTTNSTHFYTHIWDELKSGTAEWKLEALMGYVESEATPHCYSAASQPFYRFVNTTNNTHFYVLNSTTPPDANWKLEGTVGYINPGPDPALHTTVLERFYNAATQDHFYTNSVAEAVGLKANGQGYAYEFPAGWTFGEESLGSAVPPTKFKSYSFMGLSCNEGFVAAASYDATPSNPTLPRVQYVLEQVTGTNQAGIGHGTLIEQSEESNGGTFYSAKVVNAAIGKKIQFYLYSVANNADPQTTYTIYGTDGAGKKDVAKQVGETPPRPYTLECPQTTQPPPTGGETPPPGGNTGGASNTKTNMKIRVLVAIPQKVLGKLPGAINIVPPVVKTIPVEFTFVDYAHNKDETKQKIEVKFQPDGSWIGEINASLYPSDKYAVKVWGPKHGIKTICAVGPYTPHELYPTTYRCVPDDASITLKEGNNTLDMSGIVLPPGDVIINGVRDGRVDAQDLKEVKARQGKTDAASIEIADLDYDGKVDEYDPNYIIWSIQHIP